MIWSLKELIIQGNRKTSQKTILQITNINRNNFLGRKVGRIREGFPEDMASEQDHKGQMEGTWMEKGGNITQIKRTAREKNRQRFQSTQYVQWVIKADVGVNQRREQREDRSPDLDNQSSHTGWKGDTASHFERTGFAGIRPDSVPKMTASQQCYADQEAASWCWACFLFVNCRWIIILYSEEWFEN